MIFPRTLHISPWISPPITISCMIVSIISLNLIIPFFLSFYFLLLVYKLVVEVSNNDDNKSSAREDIIKLGKTFTRISVVLTYWLELSKFMITHCYLMSTLPCIFDTTINIPS